MQMRLITVGEDTKIYGWLKDLTVYSSNFGELKDSKVKYRVSSLRKRGVFFFLNFSFVKQILQPAKADIVMIMDKTQQKIDVRISDIIVSIAPAAVRTLIGVTSSLGTLQVDSKRFSLIFKRKKTKTTFRFRRRSKKKKKRSIRNRCSIRNLSKTKRFGSPKVFFYKKFDEKSKKENRRFSPSDSDEFDEKLETTDILETVTGCPSQTKAIKQEEIRLKEKEKKIEPAPLLIQQVTKKTSGKTNFDRFRFLSKLILTLETIEIKLEVGLGSVTKSVVALCLSKLTADLKNWSTDVKKKKKKTLKFSFRFE